MASVGFSVVLLSVGEVSAQTPYGVEIRDARSGRCTNKLRSRVLCSFPSKVSAYTNAQGIQHTGGSRATVYWKSVRVNGEYKVAASIGGSLGNKVASATASVSGEQNGKTYEINVERCVLEQDGYCQNPLRYAPVTVMVVPHQVGSLTKFNITLD
jgi:hypothetical protein